MAEPITPPDQIGAGVAPPQGTPPESLMSQLRTAPLPESMLAAMPQQTPGQAYANALAGGVAQMQGRPNPVTLQQQQQAQQMQQYAQMAERIQAMRQRREEASLAIAKDLMQSESPEARMVGARGLLTHAKASGLPVQDIEPLVKGMATKRYDMNAVLKDLEMGLDDATMAVRYPGIEPQTIQAARKSLGNDAVRTAAGLKTSLQTRKEILDLKKLEAEAMEADHPELKDAPAELKVAIDMVHRSLNGGKGYREGDDTSRAIAMQRAYAQYKALAERKQALAEETEARKAKAQEDFNALLKSMVLGQGGQGGPLGAGGPSSSPFEVGANLTPSGGSISLTPRKPVTGEALQQLTGIAGVSDALSRINAIRENPKARGEVEEYIGPWAQYKMALQSQTPMGMAGKVPASVVQMKQDLARVKNYTVRLITGAQMNKDEVPRIEQEIPTGTEPPDQFWIKYENTLRNTEMMKKRIVNLALTGNQQAMAAAQELGLMPAQSPGQTRPSPMNPQLPPGTKMEGGELVSESGKYVWRGGKWIAR